MGAWSLRGLGMLVCTLVLLGSGCALMGTSFEEIRQPVIAVLCQFSKEVVLLDPDSLKELERIPLRSQSLELDVRGREIVTAQTGGHDRDAGREFGRIDLDTGSVAYTRLSSLDIQSVAVARSGWLMLTSGLVGPDGQCLHRVSSDGGVEDLFLPPGISSCTAAGDRVWVSRFWDDEKGHPKDTYFVYDERGRPQELTSEMTRTVTLCGFDDAVIAFGLSNGLPRLVRHDANSGEVLANEPCQGFDEGPSWAWSAGDYIALADGPAADFYLADRLVLVDAESLRTVGAIQVDGVSAVCEGQDGRLVVCEGDGEVSIVDPVSLEKLASEKVGDPRGDMADVEIVP